MKGFIRKDNLIGKHKVGSSIKAVILDVDYKRNIIDLSMKVESVHKGKKSLLNQMLESENTVNARVELEKGGETPGYSIVSIEVHNRRDILGVVYNG